MTYAVCAAHAVRAALPQVCEYLVKKIPVPKRDFISPPQVRCSLWGLGA